MRKIAWLGVVALACAASQRPAAPPRPDEPHLADVRRLTQGGQNAEAYWSFDGSQLSFQARREGEQCDRIYRMKLDGGDPVPVSTGKGATTCAYFLPGNEELIYASTHAGSVECPKRPDMSKGYVWAIYPDYDIYKARADGTGVTRLTETPGYDAEGTVCAKDGSIVFTSVRDGDLELYRMDRDGKNVRRLTNAPGYDGGAFFNADCTKIVWRASRPKPGPELEEYRALLEQGLVKPGQLEIWVANADGSDPVQVTYLGAASFAPSFFPDGKRIIFSSNYGDPAGREFDLWAVGVDGTGLERITSAPGFDGFPLFSPDGKWLAFGSNRAFPPGVRQTDVYVARWVPDPMAVAADAPPDRILRDVAWLADPAREGRGVGTAGLEASGAYIEQRFRDLGLQPAGDAGGYRQAFDAPVSVRVEPDTAVSIDGVKVPGEIAVPGFSASAEVEARAVLAGYGISDSALGRDDYSGVDVNGAVVVIRRFVPEGDSRFSTRAAQQRFGDLRYKAWIARQRGAKALVIVDWPEGKGEPPAEARLPSPHPETSDGGIPVVVVQRAALTAAMPKLVARQPVAIKVRVALLVERKTVFNVVGRIPAGAKDKLPGAVLVGAHYDHLGMGGRFSLAPDRHEVHPGADDNASGVATVIEIARALAARSSGLRRDVVVAAFAGEESGLLGSTHFARSAAAQGIAGMLNLDMVGRMRGNRLSVLGSDSASEWAAIAGAACEEARVGCTLGGDGYGPSDQTPFYAAGIPVLHFFTGAHSQYHKPSDLPGLINASGAAQVARIVERVAWDVAGRQEKLTYRKIEAPAPQGDVRSFGASLGTIPDYAGPQNGQRGMLLADVRPGGAAALAGMRRGDILIRLGKYEIGGVEDLMFVLNSVKPGETVQAVVLRGDKQVTLEATFQEGRRMR